MKYILSHLLKLPQQFNKLRFPNPTILLDGCERNAAVRFFRDTAQLLLRFFAVTGALIQSNNSGSEIGSKCIICSRWRNLCCCFSTCEPSSTSWLSQSLDLVSLVIFDRPNRNSSRRICSSILISCRFFEFIRFIINRESTAFRLILDCPRMLIGALEFFIGI